METAFGKFPVDADSDDPAPVSYAASAPTAPLADPQAPPAAPPFSMTVRLSQITLDCGPLTREVFEAAPLATGRLLHGTWRGIPVAVEVIGARAGTSAQDAHDSFAPEADAILAVRTLIDRARLLERVGAALFEPCECADPARRCRSPHDLSGCRNLLYVYGVGTEPDLAALAPGLPPGPAHVIVSEPLTNSSLELSAGVLPSASLWRAASELVAGLCALSAAHVAHGDLRPANVGFRGECSRGC